MARGSAKKQHIINWDRIAAIAAVTIILAIIIIKSPPDAGERIWASTVTGVTTVLENNWVTAASLISNCLLGLIVVYLFRKCDVSWTLSLKGASDASDKKRGDPKE